MLNLMVTNSASGAGKREIVSKDTTIAEIMEMPEFAGLIVGNQIMLNGSFVPQAQWTMSLEDLGANDEGVNILSSLKSANGAF